MEYTMNLIVESTQWMHFMSVYVHVQHKELVSRKVGLVVKDLLKWAKLLSNTRLSVTPYDLMLLLLIYSLLCDRSF